MIKIKLYNSLPHHNATKQILENHTYQNHSKLQATV